MNSGGRKQRVSFSFCFFVRCVGVFSVLAAQLYSCEISFFCSDARITCFLFSARWVFENRGCGAIKRLRIQMGYNI